MKIALVDSQDGVRSCLAIRETVFVQEQNVPPEDEWDGIDDHCMHVLAQDGQQPAATVRILPKGNTGKIQRVAVMASHRGTGLGKDVMIAALKICQAKGFDQAVLDSQIYAIPFYEKLEFVAEGPEFDDAGIPHRKMTLTFEAL